MAHAPRTLIALATATFTSAANAGVFIEYKATAAAPWTVQGQNPTPTPGAVWDLALDQCAAGYWRVRVTDPSSESLGAISFTNTTAAITLIIGSQQDNDVNPAAPLSGPGALDWTQGLVPGTAIVTLQARVQRDLGPLASVQARNIVRLDVGGSIHQSYIRQTSATDTLAAITAGGSIDDNLDDPASPAAIRSDGGRIELISAAGSIMCPISVQPVAGTTGAPLAGTIGRIESTGSDIGGARPSTALADNYHATPIAARIIDAVIGRNVRSEIFGSEGVRRVESTTAGLRGSVTAPTLLPIDAANGGLIRSFGVNAFTITLSNGLPKEARIIAGLFYGYQNIPDASQPRITLGGANKLAGNIILNASNSPKPLGVGTVTVPRALMGRVVINGASTTTITQDVYTITSPALGGGAVGVASFQLYENDCTPPNNQVGRHDGVVETAFDSSSAVPVVIRNYGPVMLPAGITDPNAAFTIEKQSDANPCVWSNANPLFAVVMHPLTPGTNELRAIGLARGSIHPTPGIYRVIPSALRCDSVSGAPVVEWAASCTGQTSQAKAYLFRIAPDCDNNGVNDYIQIDALGGSPILAPDPILTSITTKPVPFVPGSPMDPITPAIDTGGGPTDPPPPPPSAAAPSATTPSAASPTTTASGTASAHVRDDLSAGYQQGPHHLGAGHLRLPQRLVRQRSSQSRLEPFWRS